MHTANNKVNRKCVHKKREFEFITEWAKQKAKYHKMGRTKCTQSTEKKNKWATCTLKNDNVYRSVCHRYLVVHRDFFRFFLSMCVLVLDCVANPALYVKASHSNAEWIFYALEKSVSKMLFNSDAFVWTTAWYSQTFQYLVFILLFSFSIDVMRRQFEPRRDQMNSHRAGGTGKRGNGTLRERGRQKERKSGSQIQR